MLISSHSSDVLGSLSDGLKSRGGAAVPVVVVSADGTREEFKFPGSVSMEFELDAAVTVEETDEESVGGGVVLLPASLLTSRQVALTRR